MRRLMALILLMIGAAFLASSNGNSPIAYPATARQPPQTSTRRNVPPATRPPLRGAMTVGRVSAWITKQAVSRIANPATVR